MRKPSSNCLKSSADSVSITAGCFLYSFRDRAGEYYGGEGFPFALVRSPKLARIVFYRVSKPQANKIAAGCLFHRPVIVRRGVTDLDEATLAIHRQRATCLSAYVIEPLMSDVAIYRQLPFLNPPSPQLSLTSPRIPPNISGTQWSAKPFPITALLKSSVAAGWAWFSKLKTRGCTAS